MLNNRQKNLVAIYVAAYPQLAELAERASAPDAGAGDLKTLGDAMAMQAYPAGVNGADAMEIGRIGL